MIRFVLEVNDNGKQKFVCFWSAAYQQSGMPEPALTSYVELAYQTSSYFDIMMFEAFCRGTMNFVNNYHPVAKAYDLPGETISIDALKRRGVISYEQIGFSDVLSDVQCAKLVDKYEATLQKYNHIKDDAVSTEN